MISVIVPVYNAEKYLHRCIDSILAQTFTDFELLLVDDGAKDRSGEICDDYAIKDSRVKVFHKENGGVSSARNVGLDNAKGDWISYIDSDDWIAKEYLSNLWNHAKTGVDLVVSFPTYIYSDGTSRRPQYSPKFVDEHNFEDIFVEHSMHQNTSPWSKLFKRAIIESGNIRFCEDMYIGEDLLFLYTYMLHTVNIYISSDNDYFYSYDLETSLTKRVNSYKSEFAGYTNIKLIIEELIKKREIKSKDSLKRLGWVIGYYTRNVLNSLYHDSTLIRKQRLAALKDLDIEPYFKYLHIPAKKERILIFLLKNRLYTLYDLVRMAVVKLI